MKVGDYVRTIYGIKKVVYIECGQDVRFDNTNGFDDDLRRYHDYDGISFNGTAWKEIVERTSPNIIDLIEVGDILTIRDIFGNVSRVEVDENFKLLSGKIVSIVTKEQFKEMEYKL